MLDRLNKLTEELREMPIVELLGVVDASGAGGAKMADKDWNLRFAFDGWKYSGGAIQNRKLTIRKPVSHEELKTVMKQIAAFEILHIQARVAEDNCFGTPHALLVNIIRKDVADADLEQHAAVLKKPVVFDDKRLGTFTLNRRFGQFEAETPWESTNIRLCLKVDESCDPQKSLAVAYALWDLQSVWNKRVVDLATTKLLDVKNRAWLQEGESPLTAERFCATMQLESISAKPNGNFEFWFADGGLFYGHAIRVSGSLSKGPLSTGIEG
jgi:hypothetical protein